ncbi:MAG TPA: preprotein translocase subunit SecE [Ktedonobacteraceae bacterium]|nr:preprotein translocase subunit SecE [Ktedonobacteraceae bacterium]
MAKTMTDKKRNASRSQTAEPKARSNEKEQPVKSTRVSREEPKESPVRNAKAAREERKEMSRQESKPAGRREARGSSSLATRFRQNRIGRFIIEAYYELRHKVTWPTFEEARNMTIAVIILSAVIGGILALVDFGLVRLFLLISSGH